MLLVDGAHRQAAALDTGAGVVLGVAEGASYGVVWDEAGADHIVPALEAGYSRPVGVSEDGTIAATGYFADWQESAYTVKGETVRPLAMPISAHGTSLTSRALDIAANGTVVGYAEVEHDDHGESLVDHVDPVLQASVWRDGGAHTLESPGGIESDSRANAVSPNARFVGGMAVMDAGEVPVMWDGDTPRALDLPLSHSQGWVTAISDAGIAVGQVAAISGGSSDYAAALWTQAGVRTLSDIVELQEGVRLVGANAINSAGQIAGLAMTPEGRRGFVLTPRTAPTITVQPPAETQVVFGDAVTVAARADGSSPISTAWEHAASADGPWEPVADAVGPELGIDAGDVRLDRRWVRAVFTNDLGETRSAATRVTVLPAQSTLADVSDVEAETGSARTVSGRVVATAFAAPTGQVEVLAGDALLASATLQDGHFTASIGLDVRAGTRLALRYAGDARHQASEASHLLGGVDQGSSSAPSSHDVDRASAQLASTGASSAAMPFALGALLLLACGAAILTLRAVRSAASTRSRQVR